MTQAPPSAGRRARADLRAAIAAAVASHTALKPVLVLLFQDARHGSTQDEEGRMA